MTTFTLFVREFEASIHFYCDFLGFVVAYDWQKPGEDRIVRLRNSQYSIQLSLQKPVTEWEYMLLGKQGGRYPYLNMEVNDLEKHYSRLVQAGAPFDRELVSAPFGDFAYLTDPDGNKVSLSEYWVDT